MFYYIIHICMIFHLYEFFVAFQMLTSSKFFVTEIALVWFFSGVASSVCSEVTIRSKCFITYIAFVWLFSSMCLCIHTKITIASKTLFAKLADKRFFFGVYF